MAAGPPIWLQLRAAEGLSVAAQGCLQPAPDVEGGGWHRRPLTCEECNLWLGELLRRRLGEVPLGNVGSHSLKATLLSWASKRGLRGGVRRILGYHVKDKDSSVHDYSRDVFAAPLRELEGVLAEVRSGAFDPDATRSGQVRAQARAPSEDSEPEDNEGKYEQEDNEGKHGRPGPAAVAVAAAAVEEPEPPDAMGGAWDALLGPPWSARHARRLESGEASFLEPEGPEGAEDSGEEAAGSKRSPSVGDHAGRPELEPDDFGFSSGEEALDDVSRRLLSHIESSGSSSGESSAEASEEEAASEAYAGAQRWRHASSGTLHIEDPEDVDVFLCNRAVTMNYEMDDEPPAQPLCDCCFRRGGMHLLG